mgnify:CR=1 FL=1
MDADERGILFFFDMDLNGFVDFCKFLTVFGIFEHF